MGKTKVRPLAYVPPEHKAHYFYPGCGNKPDEYDADVQWYGRDEFTMSTYGYDADKGKVWIKMCTARPGAGNAFDGKQGFSPKQGDHHDDSPPELVDAHYHVVHGVPILWGGNSYPLRPDHLPVSPEKAFEARCIWVVRCPKRPDA